MRMWILVAVAGMLAPALSFGQAPAFSQVVVFGDSLSDTGNVRERTSAKSSASNDDWADPQRQAVQATNFAPSDD